MRYKKIHDFAIEVLKPVIEHLKKIKKTNRMPWKELEAIFKILYPDTKYKKVAKGYFKHVFVIHTDRKWFALKIGRNAKDIKKDYITYISLKKSLSERAVHRNYAKIYWAEDIFMLQKWGKRTAVTKNELNRLRKWGKSHGIKDVREANIMKVEGKFKIVDAERA